MTSFLLSVLTVLVALTVGLATYAMFLCRELQSQIRSSDTKGVQVTALIESLRSTRGSAEGELRQVLYAFISRELADNTAAVAPNANVTISGNVVYPQRMTQATVDKNRAVAA